jgi:hypothetical protein
LRGACVQHASPPQFACSNARACRHFLKGFFSHFLRTFCMQGLQAPCIAACTCLHEIHFMQSPQILHAACTVHAGHSCSLHASLSMHGACSMQACMQHAPCMLTSTQACMHACTVHACMHVHACMQIEAPVHAACKIERACMQIKFYPGGQELRPGIARWRTSF